MKIYKACINGHKFGEKFFKNECPYCGNSLKIVYDGWEEKIDKFFSKKRKKLVIDKLPRLPWLNMVTDNNPNVENHNKRWCIEEAKKLLSIYREIGISNEEEWGEIAKNKFKRSIYGVEYQLRLIISHDKGYINLEDYYC